MLRVVGPYALIVASAWASPIDTLFTLTVTGDRLLGVAAILVALTLLALRRPWRWTPVHTTLAVFVGIQIVTSLWSGDTWPEGLKFVWTYAMGFACFALAAEWTHGADGQARMARGWIAAAAVASLLGTVVANLANAYQRPVWGTAEAQIVFAETSRPLFLFGPQVPLGEWNLLSSFLLVPFTLSLWGWRRHGAGQGVRVAALTVMVFGLVTGITRAAWLSAAALVLLWIWMKRPRWTQVAALSAMVTSALLVQAVCLGATPLFERGLQRSTVEDRMVINAATIESWQARPLLGHGAGSVNRLPETASSAELTGKVWTGNIVLFVLHDSGMLGLAALLALVAAVGLRALGALRREMGAPAPSLVVPLIAAGAGLLFCYQFTHALWLMYPYVYLGFLTAATALDPDDP